MGRERFDAVTARIPARITSALARGRELSERRRLAHETGHVAIDMIPQDQEIVLMVHPEVRARECLDTRVFPPSVTELWVHDPNPREDAWSRQPSRIDPSS